MSDWRAEEKRKEKEDRFHMSDWRAEEKKEKEDTDSIFRETRERYHITTHYQWPTTETSRQRATIGKVFSFFFGFRFGYLVGLFLI